MKRVGFVVILIALLVVVVAYFAIPTRMELVSTPPSEFLQARSEWDAKRREAEAQLARAYWNCALVTLQWKYPKGVRLPETPPAEFHVDARELADALKLVPQSRERYWQRLREVWRMRQSWHRVRVWDLDWFTKPFEFWRKVIGPKR
jgi:hypothetical protein